MLRLLFSFLIFSIFLTKGIANVSSTDSRVIANANPTCTASNSSAICEGEDLTLMEAGGDATSWSWSTNGSATFNDAAAQNPIASEASNGEIFTVTVTDGNGCTSMCTTMATVNGTPACLASNSGLICEGEDVNLMETGGAATSWSWLTNGAATFNDATVQNPIASDTGNGEIFAVTVTDGNGCTSMCTTMATVNGTPACLASNSGPICEGEDVNLMETGGDATSWSWSTNGAATFNDATVQNPIANGASNGEIFTVTVTDENGCTSMCTTMVTVNGIPTCFASNGGAICEGVDVTLMETGGDATSWSWSTNGDAIFNDATVQNPIASGASNGEIFTVTVTDENGCTSMCTTMATVNGIPTCFASNSGVICEGEDVNLMETGGAATSWSWSTNGAATFNDATVQNPIASDTGNGEIFAVTVTDGNGCTSMCTTMATVNGTPACLASNSGAICEGEDVNLMETGGDATLWSWSTNGTATFNDVAVQNPIASGAGNGEIFTVTVTDGNGCTSMCTTMATVNGTPTCFAGNSGPICEGEDVNLMETGGAATSWSWSTNGVATFNDVAVQNPIASGAGNGEIFTVTVTDGNGCTSICTTTVTVNVNPTCDITGATSVVENTQDETYSGLGGMETYAWIVTDGDAEIDGASNSQSVNIDFGTENSTIELTITDSNGCSSTCTIGVTMTTSVVCSISGPSSTCVNTNGLVFSGPISTTYVWSVTEGNAMINGSTTMQNVTVDAGSMDFTLTLMIESGIPSSCSYDVTVNATPTCTASNNGPICEGSPVMLMETGDDATEWSWSTSGSATFNDASAQNPIVSGVVNGEIFTVMITDDNGCTSTCTTTVMVNSHPSCAVSNNGPICEGSPVSLMESGGEATKWSWSTSGSAIFNDALAQSPVVSGAVKGETFTVTVTDGNGCESICTTIVSVFESPVCTVNDSDPICEGEDVTLMESGVEAAEWSWSTNGSATFNDASVQNPVVSGAVNGEIFTVMVTDGNGCGSMCTTTVSVFESPVCTVKNNGPICEGANVILEESSGDVIEWSWSTNGSATFNDASVQNPVVNGAINGEIFTVTVTDGNGCTSMCTTVVIVNEIPACTVSNSGPICEESSVMLMETGGDATEWSWASSAFATFNDATVQNPVVSGTVNGEIFTVTVTDGNGCINSSTNSIIVFDLPSADFDLPTGICTDADPIAIEGDNIDIGMFSGDGISDNLFDPDGLALGDVTITYTVIDSNNCSDSTIQIIEVFGLPSSDIVTMESSGLNDDDGVVCENDSLKIMPNASLGQPPYNYEWYFDGDMVSSNDGVLSVYNASSIDEGFYTLTIMDENGCIHTSNVDVDVLRNPTADINLESEDVNGQFLSTFPFSIDGSASKVNEPDINGISYSWKFNPSVIINEDLVSESSLPFIDDVIVNNVGEYYFELTYTDENNCSNTEVSSEEFLAADDCRVFLNDKKDYYCINEEISGFTYVASPSSIQLLTIRFELTDQDGNFINLFTYLNTGGDVDAELEEFSFGSLEPGEYRLIAVINETDGCMDIERMINTFTVLPEIQINSFSIDSTICSNDPSEQYFIITVSPSEFDFILNYEIISSNDTIYQSDRISNGVEVDFSDVVDNTGFYEINITGIEYDLSDGICELESNNFLDSMGFDLIDCSLALNAYYDVKDELVCLNDSVVLSINDDLTSLGLATDEEQFFLIGAREAIDKISKMDEEMFYFRTQDSIFSIKDLISWDENFGKEIFVYNAIIGDGESDYRISSKLSNNKFTYYPNPIFVSLTDFEFCEGLNAARIDARILNTYSGSSQVKEVNFEWTLNGTSLTSNRVLVANDTITYAFINTSDVDLFNLDVVFTMDNNFSCSNMTNIDVIIRDDAAPDFKEIRWWPGNILSCLASAEDVCYDWGYIDHNGTGDITDDQEVTGEAGVGESSSGQFYYPDITTDFFNSEGVPRDDFRTYFVDLYHIAGDGSCEDGADDCVQRVYYTGKGFVLERSIDLLEKLEMVLFPNPTSSYLDIQFNQAIKEGSILLKNSLGELVYRTDLKNTPLHRVNSIEELPNGIYFIEFINQYNTTLVNKFIKH